MPNYGLKTNITSGYLRNYSLLRASDFPDTTGLYIWPLNGVGSFSGVNSYGGLDLTQVGTVATSLNHLGNTVYDQFNGTNAVTYVNSTALDDTGVNSFTVGGWIKCDTLTSRREQIFSKYVTTNAASSFYVELDESTTSGIAFGVIYNGGGSNVFAYTNAGFASYRDGNWHHIVVVYNQTTSSLMICMDGKIVAYKYDSNLATRNNPAGSKLAFSGYDPTGTPSRLFNGKISDVFYKKSAMTFDQIRKIYVVGTKKFAYLDELNKVRIDGEIGPRGSYRATLADIGATIYNVTKITASGWQQWSPINGIQNFTYAFSTRLAYSDNTLYSWLQLRNVSTGAVLSGNRNQNYNQIILGYTGSSTRQLGTSSYLTTGATYLSQNSEIALYAHTANAFSMEIWDGYIDWQLLD